jgi:apolipoprotein N-acyltransferase
MTGFDRFLQRRHAGSAVAFLAGALLSASFAPTGLWPLAILCPAVLIYLWDGAAPRRAAVLGFWFNAGTFSVGTYWLYISLRLIGHAPIPLALLLMLALVAIMGAYHAALGWAVAKYLPPRGAVRWLLAIPGAWLLVEWFRSWFLSGFGWLSLGYAHTSDWLGALAPVVGQCGLSLLSLMLAGCLVALALGTKQVRIGAAAMLAVIVIAPFTVRDVEWTQPSGKPISVAIVQGAIPQDEKWLADQASMPMILDRFRTLTVQAHGADLIVWPESTIPDLINYHVDYLREVYQAASATGSALLLGALRAQENPQTGEEEVFNSVLVWDPATRGVGFHDKYHLVPFSEFFPVPDFIRSWLRLMDLPYSSFNRGAAVPEPLPAAGQKISIGICYEDAYASTLLPSLREATMLVNVTNDSWFGRSSARYQHLQISRMRAREAGRPMVRAANDGVSAVIGADGNIVASAPEYEANVMRADLQPRTGLTPYARTGNWLVVSLALVFGLFGAYLGRKRPPAPGAT